MVMAPHMMRNAFGLMSLAIVLVALFRADALAAADFTANVIKIADLTGATRIDDQIDLYKDEAGNLVLDDVRKLYGQGEFSQGVKSVDRSGGQKAVYWTHFYLENDTDKPAHLVLSLPHKRAGSVKTYLMKEGHITRIMENGFLSETNPALQTNRFPIWQIFLEPGEQYKVFVRVENIIYLHLPLTLTPIEIFNKWIQSNLIFFGLLGGVMLAAFLYLLIMWKLVPGLTVPSMLGYIGFCSLYIVIESGISRDFVGFLGVRVTTTLILLAVVGVWFSGFTLVRSFLATPITLPKFDRYLIYCQYSALIMAVLAPIFPETVRTFLIYTNPILLGFMITSGILAIRKKLPGAQAYLFASIAVFIGSAIRNGLDWGLVAINDITGNAMYLGMATSAVTLAFAVSEKIRSRQEESDNRQRAIVQSSMDGIVTFDIDGRILDMNAAAERIFGFEKSQLMGHLWPELIVSDKVRNALLKVFQEIKDADRNRGETPPRRGEITALRANGEEFPIEVSLSRSLANHKPFYAAHVRDLTERKDIEAELERKREQLFQSEKLSALGGLLAGVAHELNNPLSIIVGRSSMLKDTSSDDMTSKTAKKIYDAAQRCARIVRTFLAMARQRPQEREATSLNDIVEAALDLLRFNLKADGIDIVSELEADLPNIMADTDQLTQVLINIIVNAQHAMADQKGLRRLTVRTKRLDKKKMCRIVVEDTGPGIPEDIRIRIFDPFFTTKPVGSGTGLGLSVSRGMIESHGGKLDVESRLGKGSRFIIELPCLSSDESGNTRHKAQRPTAGTKLLVVEDDVEGGATISALMKAQGYQVTVSSSARDALFRLHSGDFDIVISDFKMPDMNGLELFKAARARDPRLARRWIFITGDTIGTGSSDLVQESSCPVVEKPLNGSDLIEAIESLLADGTNRTANVPEAASLG